MLRNARRCLDTLLLHGNRAPLEFNVIAAGAASAAADADEAGGAEVFLFESIAITPER